MLQTYRILPDPFPVHLNYINNSANFGYKLPLEKKCVAFKERIMKQLLIFLISVCFFIPAIGQTERLIIPWPETWKIGSQEKNHTMSMVELIPNNEKIDQWTIIGTTTVFTGKQDAPIDATMNLTFNEAKKAAVNPTLTFIDKKEDSKNPWILFKIESASYKNNNNPESQLFYIVEGDEALYSNFVAIKESTLSKEFVDHWKGLFKSSKFVKLSQ